MSDTNDQGSMTVSAPSSGSQTHSGNGSGANRSGGRSKSNNTAVANVEWGSGSITETIGNVVMTFEGTHAINVTDGKITSKIVGDNPGASSAKGGNESTFHPARGELSEINPTITYHPLSASVDAYDVAFPTLTIRVTITDKDASTLNGYMIGQYHGQSEKPSSIIKQHIPKAIAVAKEFQSYQTAIQAVIDFYKEATSRLGDRAASLAKDLANKSVGTKIRNYDEALAAFEKVRANLYGKMSAKDRQAISNALASLDNEMMAKQLKVFSKAFGLVSDAITYGTLVNEIRKSLQTGEWGGVITQTEAIAAGKLATALVAFVFAAMTSTPLGILGFALLSALVSAFVNDSLMSKVNSFISSL